MTNMLKKFHTIILGSFISITFWVLESFIDQELDEVDNIRLIPGDANELWMRSLIVILIMVMSIYVHFSQAKELKIEREKLKLQEQLLDEQYNKMELILNTRKLTQEALRNFNNNVNAIKQNIEAGAVLSENELSRLLTIITAVQNKLSRLWS
jgi:CRISPR/Cas system-associated endonuclease Cas3-HD